MVRRTLLVGASMVCLALGVASCGSTPKPLAIHHATHKLHTVAAVGLAALPAGDTYTAQLKGDTPGSPAPGAPSNQIVPGTWYGYPSVLPIIAEQGSWIEVRLAQRPNESTAWVPKTAVSMLGLTPYRMELNLTTMHLSVFKDDQPILDFPAGIGTPDDPTVTGQYFVTMTVPPPNAGYGPFVLVTSAHSDAITDWSDSGDAIIAIHGPITSYDDSLIGTTGAAISHGCIRLHDADLAQLDIIPAGTPLDIVS
jgi:L,D-transpeptidase catalytic domain